MNCYTCQQETERRCSRCGRPYCDDHGDELCGVCMDPAGGLPSALLYRGSLLALVVASVFTVWLLVSPPHLPGDEREAAAVTPFVPTPVSQTTAAGLPTGRTTPTAAAGTPVPTATSTATAPATPIATPTAAVREYIVQSGDTLSSIAQRFGVTIEAIVQANSLSDPGRLSIGQTLVIPPP